jgi:hypothetical protein
VDRDYDGRTSPGAYVPMRFPRRLLQALENKNGADF